MQGRGEDFHTGAIVQCMKFTRSHFSGRVLLGLFRNRNTQNIWYLCSFWSRIPFLEYHSVHSAPDSRMNRMEGIRFTRNRQNMDIFGGKSFAAARAGGGWQSLLFSGHLRHGYSVSRLRSVLFEIEIPCILLFLNRNKNS